MSTEKNNHSATAETKEKEPRIYYRPKDPSDHTCGMCKYIHIAATEWDRPFCTLTGYGIPEYDACSDWFPVRGDLC
jgi:hypothetical protein